MKVVIKVLFTIDYKENKKGWGIIPLNINKKLTARYTKGPKHSEIPNALGLFLLVGARPRNLNGFCLAPSPFIFYSISAVPFPQ